MIKLITFYTGFPSVGVLFNFCNPGKDGENILYCHSSFTSQDTTVLNESSLKVGRPWELQPKEELFLTLCRLRQDFAEDHLAYFVWYIASHSKQDYLGEHFVFEVQGYTLVAMERNGQEVHARTIHG